ncbi:MAG TPA: hypothetical protein VMI94_01925 [Bryobacteraceae bacterium]|nr:hypothetical protein [Bryobacteraceae bacterium]
MFVEHYDPTGLRQGDIIADVSFPLSRLQSKPKFLGALKQGTGQDVQLDADTELIGKSWWLTAQIHAVVGYCAVLSTDCDVAPKQKPPPPSFVLCRLVPVPDGVKKNQALLKTLMANVDPYGSDRPFYQLFYVGNHSRLGAEEYVADYGMTMTVAWKDYDAVLKRKTLELDDETRAKFRVKAGAYFGRPTPEDVEAGLGDPWKAGPERPRSAQPFRQRIFRAWQVLKGEE